MTSKATTTTEVQAAPAEAGFLAQLEASRPALAGLIPDERRLARVMRIARTAWQLNPDLQRCSPRSILAAVMKAAELDLEPAGALQHAWLIPYKGECQFQISYKGLLELARRTGRYRSVGAELVHAKDHFALERSPEPVMRHVPFLGDVRGTVTHVYAYARFLDRTLEVEVMTHAEVEQARAASKAPNSPAWRDWWGEMARKVVTKRFLKRQPLSVTLAEVIDHDNRQEAAPLASWPSIAGAHPEGLSRSADLARRLAGPAPAPAEPEFAEGTEGIVAAEDEPAIEPRDGVNPGD